MKNTNNLSPPASSPLAGARSDSLSFPAGGEFDGDRDAGGAIELTGPAVVVGGKNIVFAVGGGTVDNHTGVAHLPPAGGRAVGTELLKTAVRNAGSHSDVVARDKRLRIRTHQLNRRFSARLRSE